MKKNSIPPKKIGNAADLLSPAARVKACSDALMLRLRARGTLAEVLNMDDAQLLAAMPHDEWFEMYVEVLKLQQNVIDFEKFQTHIRNLTIIRIIAVFLKMSHPDMKATILAPLDWDELPSMPSFSDMEINGVRPQRIAQQMYAPGN